MSDEKNRAYMEGLRLKNTGLDEEIIYARLEKQGIPQELAKQVAKDVMIERQRDAAKAEEPFYQIAILKIGIGVIAAVISAIMLPGRIIIPIGLIGGGIIYALLSKSKTKN